MVHVYYMYVMRISHAVSYCFDPSWEDSFPPK